MAGWSEQISSLIATGHVTRAAIHGLDGSCWASSAGFKVSVPEAKSLRGAIESPEYAALLPIHGMVVAGEKYTYLRSDKGRNLLGKKGLGGCFVTKTSKALIIAVFDSPISPADCVVAVERFADYLVSMQL